LPNIKDYSNWFGTQKFNTGSLLSQYGVVFCAEKKAGCKYVSND